MTLWDPGAQPERTALAWARTTLALITAGLLCVRLAGSAAAAALAAAVVCGAAGLQLRHGRTRLRTRLHRLPEGAGAADPTSVLTATALTILLAAVAVLVALT